MKYILNKTPIKTTNKDAVNEFIIDTIFDDYKDTSKYNINTSYKESISSFESKIGISFNKCKNIEIDITKDTDLECDILDTLIDTVTLNIKDKSKVNIIYKSSKKIDHHLKLVINGNNDSIINIINLTDIESRNLIAIEAYVSSNITVNLIDLGGSLRVYNYYALVIDGINTFNNIYLTKNDELDLNYYIKLINPKCEGYINSKGILNNTSKKNFKGTIDFVSGCKDAIGREEEKVIMLSNDAKNKSLPILLCGEEDVCGAHSSSVGGIDLEKLFYLESRGMDSIDAKKEIILGEFNEILDYLPNKDYILNIIRERL